MKQILYSVGILVGLWLTVNLVHAVWVYTRRVLWERHIQRGPDGLLLDAAGYQIGEGTVAVLFIHGFADTPRVWWRFASRLAGKGAFTCRVMRLPGCAESLRQARKQSLVSWRTQVADEVIRLREHHDQVWVVGHSMGGALALDVAIRQQDIVDGVAVFAPLIDVSRARAPLLHPATWFRLAQLIFALSPTFESPFSVEAVAVDDPSFRYTRDRFIPFGVYRGLFALVRSNRRQATRLKQPLFAVTAMVDAVVDTPAALRWLTRCPVPKEIHDLAQVGHVIPLERGWQELADQLATFIHAQSGNTKPDAESL